MPNLFVVNYPERWPLHVPGVQVVAARQYLTDPSFSKLKQTRVFNLCRSYAYQSLGYYVSLLAEARGHKPKPDILTLQDMKHATIRRVRIDELDTLVQSTLRKVPHDTFDLSIYFGKTLAKRDQRLGRRLFGQFPAPMMRAFFVKRKDRWQLQTIRAISGNEIPESHRPSVIAAAEDYFHRREWSGPSSKPPSIWLAILVDPDEEQPPTGPAGIRKFVQAAHRQNVGVEVITKDDYSRIGEFDALLIRTTTAVDHYTFRFARRAAAEGLAVIDDPQSILRCTNKVYLAELLNLHGIATPQTLIVHKENVDDLLPTLGLPCVLKAPDSSFSMGVKKAETPEELTQLVNAMLADSDLILAQGFMPTAYDWRVGVLDGKPLFVCRYHMARKHWQILTRSKSGRIVGGNTDTHPISRAPKAVVDTAVKAANLIGDGLYGVDLKEVDGTVYVIEVNDNPNIDPHFEDDVIKDKLYDRVIRSLVRRVRQNRAKGKPANGKPRTSSVRRNRD